MFQNINPMRNYPGYVGGMVSSVSAMTIVQVEIDGKKISLSISVLGSENPSVDTKRLVRWFNDAASIKN
jgi:hypothetical protein